MVACSYWVLEGAVIMAVMVEAGEMNDIIFIGN
jgi:hypothetical protein